MCSCALRLNSATLDAEQDEEDDGGDEGRVARAAGASSPLLQVPGGHEGEEEAISWGNLWKAILARLVSSSLASVSNLGVGCGTEMERPAGTGAVGTEAVAVGAGGGGEQEGNDGVEGVGQQGQGRPSVGRKLPV